MTGFQRFAEDHQRRVRVTGVCMIVAGISVSAALAGQVAGGAQSAPAASGGPATTATTTHSEDRPCSGEWSALVDFQHAPGYPSVEKAVAARGGPDYQVIDVNRDPRSDMTFATVRDGAGATGTYELAEYQGNWFISGGSGCAAR
jgi:hypothetical protein